MSEFTSTEEDPTSSAVSQEKEIADPSPAITTESDDMKMKEEVTAVFVERDALPDEDHTDDEIDANDATSGTVDTIASTTTSPPSEAAAMTGEVPFDNSFYSSCTKEKYDKLREKVQDDSFTDTAYLRFLTACDQDVEKASASMIKNSEWKKRKNVYEIDLDRDCPFQNAKGLLIYREDLYDFKKRPVFYNVIRRHDKNDRDIDELEKFIVGNIMRGVSRAVPQEEKIVIILDLKGFSMQNMDFEGTKLLIDLLQKRFPENLGNLHILNAPFIFQACWTIIKPWIDKRTVKKVCFVNTEQLKEYVDVNALPKEVGKEYDQQFKDAEAAVKNQQRK